MKAIVIKLNSEVELPNSLDNIKYWVFDNVVIPSGQSLSHRVVGNTTIQTDVEVLTYNGTLDTDQEYTTYTNDKGDTIYKYVFSRLFDVDNPTFRLYALSGITKIMVKESPYYHATVFDSDTAKNCRLSVMSMLMHFPRKVSDFTNLSSDDARHVVFQYDTIVNGSLSDLTPVMPYYATYKLAGVKGLTGKISDFKDINTADYTFSGIIGKYALIRIRDQRTIDGTVESLISELQAKSTVNCTVRVQARWSNVTYQGSAINTENLDIVFDANGDYTIVQS